MSTRPPSTPPRLELTGTRVLDAMLPAGGVAIVLALLHAAPLAVFIFAAIGLVPLAAVLGHATSALAARLGPLAAGLVQATLGNASELILGLAALSAGLVDVVKASLTGSIISNLLMVLGLSILAGGWGRPKQQLDPVVARTNVSMLFLASVGLVVPAVFALGVYGHLAGNQPVLQHLSDWTAGILIVIYVASLVFQLNAARQNHREQKPTVPRVGVMAGSEAPDSIAHPTVIMLVTVILIAVLSRLLVDELNIAKLAFHGTDLFWGGVVFALIGNAAEHGVAVAAARRDEMDLAMAIGVGSSLQIALLMAPLLVFASLLFGHPMSLVFTGIEIVAVMVSVGMVGMIALDGETNWLEGAQLIAVYAILVVAFYFVPA